MNSTFTIHSNSRNSGSRTNLNLNNANNANTSNTVLKSLSVAEVERKKSIALNIMSPEEIERRQRMYKSAQMEI